MKRNTRKNPDVTREEYSFADDLNLHTSKAIIWAKNWLLNNEGRLVGTTGEFRLRIEDNEALFLKTTKDMLRAGLSISFKCHEPVYREVAVAGNGKLVLA